MNPITLITNSIESSLCDYSDAFILVTGNIDVTGGHANTKIAVKNCTQFKTCRTEINNVFVNEAEYIYIAMHMYNLIEHSDNYYDTSGSSWQFKRNEIDDNADVSVNPSSFKYKSDFIGDLEANGTVKSLTICCTIWVIFEGH